jgi:hypothetical protein
MIIEHDSGPGLELSQLATWRRVKDLRTAKLASGCAVPGVGTFQTDEKSMANILEAVSGAMLATIAGLPYTVSFTLANDTRPVFNGQQMMMIGKFIGERKSAIHAYSQDVLRVSIFATASHVELEALDIETGWPN